jgi:hypothetical protein
MTCDCQTEIHVGPRQRRDVKTRHVGDEVVVLDRKRERIHQLNRTASFVWARCDGRHSMAEIAGEVAAAFDVDPARAGDDVATLVRELEARALLEPPDRCEHLHESC